MIELVTRRDLIKGGLLTAAALGLGISSPFVAADVTNGVCTLTCAQTLGPCYYSATSIREDITEGRGGLPTRLSFLIVNADTCQPVTNASIDIWHTDATGIYSAPINTMCTGSDLAARSMTFCRGVQYTDSSGWAHFNTVFPGWYSSRTTHIHATVRVGNTAMVTTHFYFDDALTDSIYQGYAPYSARPNRDTKNTTDNILGGSLTRMAPYIFSTKLLRGQSLVALKVIGIRNTVTSCNA